MQYLNPIALSNIKKSDYRSQTPYPWINPENLIAAPAYQQLRDTLPDASLFEKRFGYQRDYGQKGHDRYSLEYNANLDIDPHWHDFIAELNSREYHQFLRRLIGFRPMKLAFHWHYTPTGCAVNPHCDSNTKLGSHIFYLNTEQDWKKAWGGETLILDDHGKIRAQSAPTFDDFDPPLASEAMGNRSLLFSRTAHSWHGVKAISCPEGQLRKVFIVTIKRIKPIRMLEKYFSKKD